MLVELDHQVAYPEGRTSTDNLGPLCERHHQVKHAEGYTIVRNPDGSYTWTTRPGSTFTTPASEQPVPTWPEPGGISQEHVDEIFAALTTPMEKQLVDLIVTSERP